MARDISTSRLLLRERTMERLAEVFAKPEAEQLAFFGYTEASQMQRDREMFATGWTNYKMDQCWYDLVLPETNECIGAAGYHLWFPDHARAEIGYYTFEPHRRKGYMKEALTAIIEFGFDSLKLNRIEACVGPNNDLSIGIVTSYGFVREGWLREHYHTNGRAEDSIIYALLRSDYEQHKMNNR